MGKGPVGLTLSSEKLHFMGKCHRGLSLDRTGKSPRNTPTLI